MAEVESAMSNRGRINIWVVATIAALGVVVVCGASSLSFLCDDAYITFRYVHNAHAGDGLVWNPAPFAPVEGYTSFSWALLLWAAWSWFGAEPPVAANWLSLACGLAQFAVVVWAALSMRNRAGKPIAILLALLTIGTIACNRSFLQWMSGGLETPLFNLMFVSWVLWAFRANAGKPRWLVGWALLATGAALTRPDGLLMAATTALVAVVTALRSDRRWRLLAAGFLPLAPVAAHVLWRRWFYGEWLPNTYFAKVGASWPEAGFRYLACFVIEHGTWVVAVALFAWAIVSIRSPRALAKSVVKRPCAIAATLVTVYHVAFYTWKVGGDHFEYRVFSQLVPLSVLAVAWLAVRTCAGKIWPVIAITGIAAGSLAGWGHLAMTRNLPLHGFIPIASQVPAVLQPAARWYDRQQAWLIFHRIGLRCQQHGMLLESFRTERPDRLPFRGDPEANATRVVHAVGYIGWVLPECRILDYYGLNDWVVARWREDAPPTQPFDQSLWQRILNAVDQDHDGWLDEAELQAVIGSSIGRFDTPGMGSAEFLTSIALASFADERTDALSKDQAGEALAMFIAPRFMAHERRPPKGYFEDFEPNLDLQDGVAVARRRETLLTPARVQELESKWRDRVRANR